MNFSSVPSKHHKLLGKHFYGRCPKFWRSLCEIVARRGNIFRVDVLAQSKDDVKVWKVSWLASISAEFRCKTENIFSAPVVQRNSILDPASCSSIHIFSSRSKTRRQIGSKIGTTHGRAAESLDSSNCGIPWLERISQSLLNAYRRSVNCKAGGKRRWFPSSSERKSQKAFAMNAKCENFCSDRKENYSEWKIRTLNV